MRILMVCLGNICRSPIAEGVMKHIASRNNLDWDVASAGTEHSHIGEPPHMFSQKICQKHGIDISQQRARRFSASDIGKFDRIYAMSADVLKEIRHITGTSFDGQKISLFLNESYPGSNRSVPDPWYGPEDGYTEVFDMIEKTCEKIVTKYR